ncbi:hypothetical protein IW262DRAFT_504739 [Armillaria fumosa]|nr:hypothetical protein IW262DRAFT_504739 [Armillaria fumosa]
MRVSHQIFAISSFIMFRSPSLQPHDTQRGAEALSAQYCGSENSRRSTASGNPTDFFRPLPREAPQSQRGSDAERLGSDDRYHSTPRAGRYMRGGSPLPYIPPEDSNVPVNSPMSFARPVPDSDLTPTGLEFTSPLERNRMHGSSVENRGPAFPRVSRSPATSARTGAALGLVHEQSTDMMLDSRGMVRYAPPTTSLVMPQQPQPYQQGFDAAGRPILYRDCVPISTAVSPDMFREMHSTSDILSREGIDHIDKGLDGNFYAFSRSFPRGVDVTTLWRQLYGAMAQAFLLPSRGRLGLRCQRTVRLIQAHVFNADASPDSSLHSYK